MPQRSDDRATVTEVEFHLRDFDADHAINGCTLMRVRLDPRTGDFQRMAGPRVTSGAPGYVTLADPSIDHAVVKDRYYAYWAECNFEANSGLLGVVGVTVRDTP